MKKKGVKGNYSWVEHMITAEKEGEGQEGTVEDSRTYVRVFLKSQLSFGKAL